MVACSFIGGGVLYGSYHSDNISAGLIYFATGIVWLFFFYRLVKCEHQNPSRKIFPIKYAFSTLALFSVVPVLMVYIHYERKLATPSLIKASNHGVYADFKTDGTYIIKSGSWASRKHFYGRYILKDSIIQTDRDRFDKVLTSNLFAIRDIDPNTERNKPGYARVEGRNYLVQIDSSGSEILGRDIFEEILPYKFVITLDKRH